MARVRTTLDLDADVLSAARELATQRGATLGAVVSDLIRAGLSDSRANRSGVSPPLPVIASTHAITSEMVADARDDD